MGDDPRQGRTGDSESPLPPVVFVPGFGHGAHGWRLLRRHLGRAGFDHTSLFPATPEHVDIPHLADQLAHHVESLRALAEAESVYLVGHNVGGIVARYFVQVLGGDAVTAGVVTVETPHAGTGTGHVAWGVSAAQVRPGSAVLRRLEETARPMTTRWITYFSHRDLFVRPATSAMLRSPVLRATNLLVEGTNHLSLVIPPNVSRSVARELVTLEVEPKWASHPRLGGVAAL